MDLNTKISVIVTAGDIPTGAIVSTLRLKDKSGQRVMSKKMNVITDWKVQFGIGNKWGKRRGHGRWMQPEVIDYRKRYVNMAFDEKDDLVWHTTVGQFLNYSKGLLPMQQTYNFSQRKTG